MFVDLRAKGRTTVVSRRRRHRSVPVTHPVRPCHPASVENVVAAVLAAVVAGAFALLGVMLPQRHEKAQAQR
jgi:hypothetical protein